jgi:hypothetical protein
VTGEKTPSDKNAGTGDRGRDSAPDRESSLSDAFRALADQRAKHRRQEAAERRERERAMAEQQRRLAALAEYARAKANADSQASRAREQLDQALRRLLSGDPDGYRLYYEAMCQYTKTLGSAASIRPPTCDLDRPRLDQDSGSPRRARQPALPGELAGVGRKGRDSGESEGLPSRLSRRGDRPDVSRADPGT